MITSMAFAIGCATRGASCDEDAQCPKSPTVVGLDCVSDNQRATLYNGHNINCSMSFVTSSLAGESVGGRLKCTSICVRVPQRLSTDHKHLQHIVKMLISGDYTECVSKQG